MLVNVTSAAFRFLYNHLPETDDEGIAWFCLTLLRSALTPTAASKGGVYTSQKTRKQNT